MTVDGFVQTRVLPEYRGIVKMLRELMRECAPDAKDDDQVWDPRLQGVGDSRPRFFISRTQLHASRIDGSWRLAVVLDAGQKPHMLASSA